MKTIALCLVYVLSFTVLATEVARGEVEVVARSTDSAPDANGNLGRFTGAVLNNGGQISFRTFSMTGTTNGAADDSAVFFLDGGVLTQIAREGEAAPNGNGAYGQFSNFNLLDDAGRTLFGNTFTGTTNGSNDDDAILLFDGVSLSTPVRDGQASPDGNGLFRSMGAFDLTPTGDVFFSQSLIGTSNSPTDHGGLFRESGGTLTKLARGGDAAPDGNGMLANFISPSANAAGQTAFLVTHQGQSGSTFRGVGFVDGGVYTQVARAGDSVPGPGGTFDDFNSISVSQNGQVAFVGKDTTGLDTLFTWNGNNLQLVAAETSAVDNSAIESFVEISSQAYQNASGDIVFQATVGDFPSGDNASQRLFRASGGSLDQLVEAGIRLGTTFDENFNTIVIGEGGELSPDGNGRFVSLDPFGMNENGVVVFFATLHDTDGDASDNIGLFVTDGNDTLKITREGDAFDGSTVTGLGVAGSPERGAEASGLNDLGQVAYNVNLANGEFALALFTPDLHWRSANGDWENADNWMFSTQPSDVHGVIIDPAVDSAIDGPSSNQTVKFLQLGGSAGQTELAMQSGDLTVLQSATIASNATISLTGSALTAATTLLEGGSIVGHGTVAGSLIGGGFIHATGGVLTVGQMASYTDLSGDDWSFRVDPGDTLNLHRAAPVNLGDVARVDNGTLNAPNGVTLSPAGVLLASGNVSARVSASAGSSIVATGNLQIGDANSTIGFASDGELNAGAHTVTIHDANDAVFGALTTIGEAGSDGTLIAANGLTLRFGGNISGRGTIDTPDDSTKPFTNNGHIDGESIANPITLNGYVKGVGTLNNVIIAGTDAPGLSPARVNRGSVIYDGVLEIELGGLSLGDFDQVNHVLGDGIAELGGVLNVQLIDGFVPVDGDAFEIITAMEVRGMFDSENLPILVGLEWNIDYGVDSVVLTASAPTLPGDYNNDGTVDGADYTVWRDAEGQTGAGLAADGNSDGTIDQLDYQLWRANFGQSLSTLAHAPGSAVPEPTGMVLAFFTLASLSLAYRWKSDNVAA